MEKRTVIRCTLCVAETVVVSPSVCTFYFFKLIKVMTSYSLAIGTKKLTGQYM
jgi:hypothetical protein